MMEPFVPPHSQGAVDNLHLRLRQTRWPETVSGAKSSLGVDRELLEDLCGYWINTFDWKAQLDLLSTLHHYRQFPSLAIRSVERDTSDRTLRHSALLNDNRSCDPLCPVRSRFYVHLAENTDRLE